MPKSTPRKCSWKTSIRFSLSCSASRFELITSFEELQYIHLFRSHKPTGRATVGNMNWSRLTLGLRNFFIAQRSTLGLPPPSDSSSTQHAPKSGGAADKMNLSFVLPHQAIFTSADVTQVNAADDVDILTNHVSSIKPLWSSSLSYRSSSSPMPLHEQLHTRRLRPVHLCFNHAKLVPTMSTMTTPFLPALNGEIFAMPVSVPSENASILPVHRSYHHHRIHIDPPTSFCSGRSYYRLPRQQAHNQHSRGCSPGISSANQIGPADKSFDNPPTPSVRNEDLLYRLRVVPLTEGFIAIPLRNMDAQPAHRHSHHHHHQVRVDLPTSVCFEGFPYRSPQQHIRNQHGRGCSALESPLLIKSALPASSSTTLPLLSRCERTSGSRSSRPPHHPFEEHERPATPTTATTEFASASPPPFALGGFAAVHLNNKLAINAVEFARLEPPLLIKSALPASPSTTLPLLPFTARMASIASKLSPYRESSVFPRRSQARIDAEALQHTVTTK